jgi:uncharacterized protein (TIGR00299 family) protein
VSGGLLYLEPIGGIAGDMFLAAGLDLGVSLDALERALRGLALGGWRFKVSRAERHGLWGTHVDVEVDGTGAHGHEHGHRSLSEIRRIVEACPTLPGRAKERALEAFRVLGEAEAKIHGVSLEQVHFHEVGAVDSLVDICGAGVVLELLGNPEVWCAPPPLGSGLFDSAHGTIPAPSPAALEVLRGVPVRFEGKGELTTPTGAALVKTLAQVGSPSELVVEKVGYGVGTRQLEDRPNVLRACLGSKPSRTETLVALEANLDDATPQLLGLLLERVLERGAVDAYVVPATMKKSRPGHLFAALVPESRRDAVAQTIFAESTTLGVRWHPVQRETLERRWESVSTPYGEVRVKLGLRQGQLMNAQPEFEDCRRLAEERSVPVKRVMGEALAAFLRAR